jgi:hypothetical protein
MDLDEHVLNFAGQTEPSSLHYLMRFTEDLVTDVPQTDEFAGKDKSEAAAKTASKPDEEAPERK